MHLVGLWRYPVKSMQGESISAAELGTFGIVGDRRYGVQAEPSGRILSAKRVGRLLSARAQSISSVRISLPTGEVLDGPGRSTDSALSSWLEQSVRLVEANHEEIPTFESQADDADDASASVTWQGRPGAFVDSSPVHLLTTSSLRAMAIQRPDLDWNMARFRPNLLVETAGDRRLEDNWVGRRCSLGDVQLEIIKPCTRCVMVTRSQPQGLARQLGVLSHLSQVAEGTLGVLARVVRPGTVAVGAHLSLV
jgi:uncharacterized protein YcbX